MTEAIAFGPLDAPVEMECPDGHHSVLDPAAIHVFMAQRRFRCLECRRRVPMVALAAIVAGLPVTGICANCEAAKIDEEWGEA